MTLRFIKSTTPEAAMIKRTRRQYQNTVQARKLLTVKPKTIDDYRQAGRELAWRVP